MYKFKKNLNLYNNKKLLANFDIDDYQNFMRFKDSNQLINNWFGVSIQLFGSQNVEISDETICKFHYAFEKFLNSYTNLIDKWLIQPFNYKKIFSWFNSDKKFPSLKLSKIKEAFNQYDIVYSFKGAIETNNEGLINLFDSLMLYPIVLKGSDIEIFNLDMPFVILLNQHYTIDLISTDENIIENFINLLRSCLKLV